MMRYILSTFYFFYFLFVICPQVNAGRGVPFFIQHFDNSNGLSNSSINKLFNDADNIIVGSYLGWIEYV